MKELCQEAIDVQNACNGIALVNSLSRVMGNLRELGVRDTVELNSHPVVILWLDKLTSLAGIQNFDNQAINEAYSYCFSKINTHPDNI
jgi:hypothetical protein